MEIGWMGYINKPDLPHKFNCTKNIQQDNLFKQGIIINEIRWWWWCDGSMCTSFIRKRRRRIKSNEVE